MTDVQLSGNTFIDNDVLNFTEHQIQALRDIAARPGFSGLVEPDLSKSRTRGVFIAQWFEGNRQCYAVIGLYRTMPHEKSGELRMLRDKHNGEAHFAIMRALHSFNLDGQNDEETLSRKLSAQWHQFQETRKITVHPNERARYAYRLARSLIIYGNITTALANLEAEDAPTA